jgi:hypothetical protein
MGEQSWKETTASVVVMGWAVNCFYICLKGLVWKAGKDCDFTGKQFNTSFAPLAFL